MAHNDYPVVRMPQSEYAVESPPPPARKVRRTPLTMRQQGIDVVCRNGQFVMPSEAFHNAPMALGICQLSVELYNLIADLKDSKALMESQMNGAEDATCSLLKAACIKLNGRIGGLRSVGHKLRKHVLRVEDGKPVNEPINWGRH